MNLLRAQFYSGIYNILSSHHEFMVQRSGCVAEISAYRFGFFRHRPDTDTDTESKEKPFESRPLP